MRNMLAKIREFHEKNGFPVDKLMVKGPVPGSEAMLVVAEMVKGYAKPLRESAGMREHRAGLVLEETGELIEALANGDEVAVLDALADLNYVVNGTAIAFSLPIERAFNEIHWSNMTKTKRSPDDTAFLHKGADYRPPQLKQIIEEHRR